MRIMNIIYFLQLYPMTFQLMSMQDLMDFVYIGRKTIKYFINKYLVL